MSSIDLRSCCFEMILPRRVRRVLLVLTCLGAGGALAASFLRCSQVEFETAAHRAVARGAVERTSTRSYATERPEGERYGR